MTTRAYDRAIADFDQAIRLNPKFAAAYDNRAYSYQLRGKHKKALADYAEAIRADPAYHYSYNNMAWLLATCDDPHFRDGARAVKLARKACDLSEWKIPEYISTLAAAWAQNGNFAEAVKWERKAISATTDEALRRKMQQSLKLYTERKAYPVGGP